MDTEYLLAKLLTARLTTFHVMEHVLSDNTMIFEYYPVISNEMTIFYQIFNEPS